MHSSSIQLTYKDNDKTTTIENLEKIKNSTPDTILKLANEMFPGWIKYSSNSFTKHLQLFTKNWEFMCNSISKSISKTTPTVISPRKILIVNYIHIDHTDSKFSTINMLCSTLTKHGYLIKRTHELELCQKCSRVILTSEMCNKLKVIYKPECTFYNNNFSNKIDPKSTSEESVNEESVNEESINEE